MNQIMGGSNRSSMLACTVVGLSSITWKSSHRTLRLVGISDQGAATLVAP